MEEVEGGVFSKVLDFRHLFLLKIKIKRILDCLNEKHNAIFMHIDQNAMANARRKEKIALINEW